MKLCLLEADINKCPHFRDNRYCSLENTACGMLGNEELAPHSKYVRKPRWYEVYYEKQKLKKN